MLEQIQYIVWPRKKMEVTNFKLTAEATVIYKQMHLYNMVGWND